MSSNRKAGSVVIRLDLRGQEELMRRLQELGPAGQRVGRDLSRAMQPVRQQGQLAKAAVGELGDAIQDVAAEAGPFGRVLGSLGPVGLAAAAGLGALALGLREVFVLMDQSREAAVFAQNLGVVGRAAGVAEERVLEWRTAIQLAGGEAAQADQALEEFSKRLGEFRSLGTGEAREGLSALGLEALGASALPVEDALDRVLERLAEIEDPSRRLAIADKLGLREANPLLQQTTTELARFLGVADEIAARLDGDALARFAAAQQALNEQEARREVARISAAEATLDLMVMTSRLRTQMDEDRAAALQLLVPLEERTEATLQSQIMLLSRAPAWVQLLAQQAGLTERIAVAAVERADANERAAAASALMARAEADLAQSWVRARTEIDDPAALVSMERRAELEALVESRIRGLMTPVQQLAELEDDLHAAREAGLDISDAQIADIVAQERARLGLVTALDEELRLRQELLDMAGVVPRLRPKSPVGATEGLDIPRDPVADKAKERANENALAQSGRALGRLRRMGEEAQDAADQIDDLATGSLRILSGELMGVVEGAQSAGDAFENMGRRILSLMAEIAMQRYVIGPIANALLGPLEGLFNPGFTGAGGTKGLPGFDRGFDGMIRGNPGIDNNVLALNGRPFARVSDGEPLMIGPSLGQRAQPNVTVNVIGAPGGARVKQRQTDNGLELDVILEMVDARAASVATDISAAAAKRMQNGLSRTLAQQTALKG